MEEHTVDPNAIRTLVLSGLPADLTKAVLWKKVRKVDERVELLFPVEGVANAGKPKAPQIVARLRSSQHTLFSQPMPTPYKRFRNCTDVSTNPLSSRVS